jgi:fatty acid/phospholipid biosynthesis enzyme
LQPPKGGVFLGLNDIVLKSQLGSGTEVFAHAISRVRMALQKLHSKIKQTLASAVRRRGHKRRTLWSGVTTRIEGP